MHVDMDIAMLFRTIGLQFNQTILLNKTYMNLVPMVTWSFSKVFKKSFGLAATSSYLARGAGYGL